MPLIANASTQVTVLSEGHTLYFGAPSRAVDWFSGNLGYRYQPQQDGAVSDWLMDAVSVGFTKPSDFAARCVLARFPTLHSTGQMCSIVVPAVPGCAVSDACGLHKAQ